MSKRIIFLMTIVVVGIISFYFLFFKPQTKLENQSVFKAVPITTPLIVKINNPINFFELVSKNEILNAFGTINQTASVLKATNQINTLLNKNEQYLKLLKGKDLILTLNYSGKENINPMLILSLKSKSDIELSNKILNQLKADESVTFLSRKYNKVNINEIKTIDQTFFLAVHKGILILSDKSLLVEEAILQLDLDTVENDSELSPLLKTVGQQADINLFINHKHIDRLLSKNVSNSLKYKTSSIKNYSGWTELDINLDDHKILMSGFTNGDHLENYYAHTLNNQQSVNSRIEKVLPHSTYYYVSLTLSNVKTYFNDYQEYLKKRSLFFQREDELMKIERETGKKIQDEFQNIIEQELAIGGINVDQANPNSGRVFIAETKSGSTALSLMLELQKNYIQKKKLPENEWVKSYQIDNQTSFDIYRFPYPNLPQTLFGQIFNGISANWFAVYDNYLIFGDSFRTVSKALHSNVLGETLSTSIDYNKFKSNLNARSNIVFYCNTSISLPVANLFFNKEISEQLKDNDDLRKIKSFAWQVTSTGDMLYNNSCLLYSSVVKSKPQTIWQSHMEAAFDFKPKFVLNHYDLQNKEVILQDKENQFYLINNVGRVVWQIKLDAKIKGEVVQIDYFKNGKFQYLFNTENKIYLIDRNGNNVKNFPVNLRAKASNGVAIFDYDNNKEYRFFVACSDNNIYAYNRDGNLLDGWDIFKTDHEVTQPIQHFRVEGKDYIVASDKMKDYILNRRGTIRVKTNDVYPHSSNNINYLEDRTATHEPRMVTSDTQGALHFTYFDGKHEVVKFNDVSESHYFTAENIDSDDEMEYIFVDGNQLVVNDSNGKSMLKKRFDYKISHQPNIYSFSKNTKKIGLTCKEANKIYLLDINGTLHSGFPLDGSTPFSIGFISDEMSNFNLLVGSPDGYLYNYYVE